MPCSGLLVTLTVDSVRECDWLVVHDGPAGLMHPTLAGHPLTKLSPIEKARLRRGRKQQNENYRRESHTPIYTTGSKAAGKCPPYTAKPVLALLFAA